MSTKPRNPQYFPRMKVRGARRKQLAPFQRAAGAFDRLTVTTEQAAESFSKLANLVNKEEK